MSIEELRLKLLELTAMHYKGASINGSYIEATYLIKQAAELEKIRDRSRKMSRSCRNTRETTSLQTAALRREATVAAKRIEWAGRIKVYYPGGVAK